MQQKQQLAKQERLQRFNQHVEELKVSLRQENAKKVRLMHLLRLTCTPKNKHTVMHPRQHAMPDWHAANL